MYHNQSWGSCLMYQTTNKAYKHIKIGEKAFNCLINSKIWMCGSKHFPRLWFRLFSVSKGDTYEKMPTPRPGDFAQTDPGFCLIYLMYLI